MHVMYLYYYAMHVCICICIGRVGWVRGIVVGGYDVQLCCGFCLVDCGLYTEYSIYRVVGLNWLWRTVLGLAWLGRVRSGQICC